MARSAAPSHDALNDLLKPDADDDGTFDLCDRLHGRYLDVVRHGIDGTWRGLFDNREVVGPAADRDTGRAQLLDWVRANVPGALPSVVVRKPRGGADRGQGRKPLQAGEETCPVTLRMTRSQREKFHRLGGAAWVRARLDEAEG